MLKRKGGFTYIEVLLALVVAASIFSAVFPLLTKTIALNRSSRLKLIAYESASNEIEKLKEQKISSLVAPSHSEFSVLEIPGAVGDIYITKDLGDEKIAAVDITVSWTLQDKSDQVELKTYLYGSTE